MAQSTFFLTWESHKSNLTGGISSLQQNGEFVDMTLAADGHLVKVHQMVMALASPYIKELIATTDARHPVIFLNKVSYSTLTAILEYIYTGEVMISIENLQDLVQAAKELHIKGLEDMKINTVIDRKGESQIDTTQEEEGIVKQHGTKEDVCYYEIMNTDNKSQQSFSYTEDRPDDMSDVTHMDTEEVTIPEEDNATLRRIKSEKQSKFTTVPADFEHEGGKLPTAMQYTVSNQGSLQMILNRYMYYMKYSNRNKTRQWRCVDYLNAKKCPAIVVTKDDIVVQRISAHTHPYHDKKILKKVNNQAVFAALQEAENMGNCIRNKAKDETNDDSVVSIE